MQNTGGKDDFTLSAFKRKSLDDEKEESSHRSVTGRNYSNNSSTAGLPPKAGDALSDPPPTKFSSLMSSITTGNDGMSFLNNGINDSRINSSRNSSTSSLLSERLNGYKSFYNTGVSLGMLSTATTTTAAAAVAGGGTSAGASGGAGGTFQQSLTQNSLKQQNQQNSLPPLFHPNSQTPLSPAKTDKLHSNNAATSGMTQASEVPQTLASMIPLPQSPHLADFVRTPGTTGEHQHQQINGETSVVVIGSSSSSSSSSNNSNSNGHENNGNITTSNNNNSNSNNNNNTNEKLQGLGSRQSVAMVYSPTLQGNIAVQALPLAQIAISTYKIFKFRVFAVSLELSEAYIQKNHLTDDEILKAGLGAKCYREGDFGTPLLACPSCCPNKRIIELGVSSKQAFAPRKTSYGTRVYTFDTCKTNCSSSRDHHKSNLVIAIDTLPDAGIVASLPFVIQAREKQQGIRKGKATVSASAVLPHPGGIPTQVPTLSPAFATHHFFPPAPDVVKQSDTSLPIQSLQDRILRPQQHQQQQQQQQHSNLFRQL